jgi:glycosyltransferase involved in cell wall biosynthesis
LTRVLFVTESFHPVMGGGETHIRRLGGALVRAGDQATVVARRGEASWPARETLDGIDVLRVAPSGPGRGGKYRMVPRAFAALCAQARRHDVVVVRGTRVLGVPALAAARFSGLPVVMQPEINGELDGTAFTWGRSWAEGPAGRLVKAAVRMRNLWLCDAEAFVAMSRRIRDEMAGSGVPAERIALLPHGIDTERFRPPQAGEPEALRARLGLPAGTVFVYTGRLLRGKGLESLLDAFTPIAAERADVHLLFVGSGAAQSLSIEEALRERAAAAQLAGRVSFAGSVERVEEWLRAADVFVFPSEFEALGISLVEAAGCGLAAIGSRTGGIVDVIEDGRSGLLVPPRDTAALAAAMRRLAADPVWRRALGERARAVALQGFDERDSLARYRALFREVTARWRGVRWPGRAPRAGAGLPPSPAARA